MAADAEPAPWSRAAPLGALVAGCVFALDQISKWVILGPLGFSPEGCREDRSLCGSLEISSIFDLTMVWNKGVSFGLLQADGPVGRVALAGFALAVAGFLAWWLRSAERGLTAAALGLVIGGAVGNLIDRLRFGAVVDFLNFEGPWFGWRIGGWEVGFPWVFNVADAAISVGVGLLLLDLLLEGRPKRG